MNKSLTILVLSFIFISAGQGISGQTIIEGVVVDSTNAPIVNAAVYISKTTIGVNTDVKGTYSLLIQKPGEYELTASFVGYKSKSLKIFANEGRQTINIMLSINPILLNEVTVRSKERYRYKTYSEFLKMFIGETENAGSCKILNPDDLHLYIDPGNNYIKGFSIKPLKIENKALGYSIDYDLIDFKYDLKDSLFKFSGFSQFHPMKGSARSNRIWTRNRLSAYYGSRMHFLRSLVANSLDAESYKVSVQTTDSQKVCYTYIKKVNFSNTGLNNSDLFLSIYDRNPWSVTYLENHPELRNGLLGYQPRELKSTFRLSDTVRIFMNGYYDKPYSVTWTGSMANERLGDMLPYDFWPDGERKNHDDASVSPLEKYLRYQSGNNSDEQVFVHTDRNKYYSGDTIFFQAFIRNISSWTFETGSKILYVLLFNEKNQIADSARFRITNATAPGWLTIPFNAAPGIYHLTAFTSRMQNFDPRVAFHLDLKVESGLSQKMKIEVRLNKEIYRAGDTLEADLTITDSKGKPAIQQKLESSFYCNNIIIGSDDMKTSRKGTAFVRFIIPDSIHFISFMQVSLYDENRERKEVARFRIPFSKEYLDLRFLPEGGNMILGLEQVIGFNAAGNNGEPVKIEGLLKNRNGVVVDTIHSGPYGPGSFKCRPERGMYVELLNNERVKKTWPLPDPDSSGVCLSVMPIDKWSFAVEINPVNVVYDTLFLAGIMNNTLVSENKFLLKQRQRFIIKTNDLPSGIDEIILLDRNMRPIASRLVFVNPDKRISFKVNTDKTKIYTRDETDLTISASTQDGKAINGIFSISVSDSLSGFDPELYAPGIEYTMNFNPFFPQNLPSEVLKRGLENLNGEQRDLMLMVFGWCRFNREFERNVTPEKEVVDYDLLKMKLQYSSRNQSATGKLDLVSIEGPVVTHSKADKWGEMSLSLNSLPEITRTVTLMPVGKRKGKVPDAMLTIPFNQQFFNSKFLSLPQKQIFVDLNKAVTEMKVSPLSEKTVELPEVRVVTTKKIGYINKFEEFYKSSNFKTLTHEQLTSYGSMEQAIRNLIPAAYSIESASLFNPTANIYLRQSHSFFGGNVKVMFVLDGMPIRDDRAWLMIALIPPGQIGSVTVLDGKQGHVLYGEEASGGVIFVNTFKPGLSKTQSVWKTQGKNNNVLVPISIYRGNIDFYNPSQAEIKVDPLLKNRRTLFWSPQIDFENQKPVKIRFINPGQGSIIRIVINGVSQDGLIGTYTTSYPVYDKK